MITLLIVLGSLVAYFVVGGMMAVRMLPRLWERGLAHWRFESRFPDLNDTGEKDAREGVVGMAVLWLFFWPVMVGIESLVRRVDTANPHAQQRRIKEADCAHRRAGARVRYSAMTEQPEMVRPASMVELMSRKPLDADTLAAIEERDNTCVARFRPPDYPADWATKPSHQAYAAYRERAWFDAEHDRRRLLAETRRLRRLLGEQVDDD